MGKIDPKSLNKAGLGYACMEAIREGSLKIDKDEPFVFWVMLTPNLVLKSGLKDLPKAGQELASRKVWKPVKPGGTTTGEG